MTPGARNLVIALTAVAVGWAFLCCGIAVAMATMGHSLQPGPTP